MLKSFVCFKTIKELKSEKFNWGKIPNVGGVYVVVYKNLNKPKFLLPEGTGGWFKKKNPNIEEKKLNENWINFKSSEDRILYIGKAVNLRKRIRLYMRFGDKQAAAHRGGRYIWQIAGSSNLEIYWKEVKNPREEEKKIIIEFKNKHNQNFPFANLRM